MLGFIWVLGNPTWLLTLGLATEPSPLLRMILFNLAVLTERQQQINVVFIYTSLMTNNVEHPGNILHVIWRSSIMT